MGSLVIKLYKLIWKILALSRGLLNLYKSLPELFDGWEANGSLEVNSPFGINLPEVPSNTRMGLAVYQGSSWVWINLKGVIKEQEFLKVCEEHQLTASGNLIFPVLQPKRIQTPQGIVFIG